ncbi:glutathione peroxidase [Candidatus Izemoplasma sp. B36]|uniref:glutathione peroxidase n=1 Tax=Candidatus Izemoplasma sp. B36 TaxID=3242468 RepID=UPI0035565656
MNLYDIEVMKMNNEKIKLEAYRNKVILIVNTASKCGFTKQFGGLEELYKKFKDRDFIILGFPCNQFLKQDPGTNEEILEFCQLNFGVTFPMFAKLEVRGKNQNELYKYLIKHTPVLTGKSIKWNFEKFLINRDGEIINRFVSKVTPKEIELEVEKLL